MRTALERFGSQPLDPDVIARLETVLEEEEPSLIGREGFKVPLPDPVFHVLLRTIQLMKQGQAVVLMPEDECVTTKVAAEFLGVSRPFLVGLLEAGEIPFHTVGAHRRIAFRDLAEYRKKREGSRKDGMRALFDRIQAEGHYQD